MNVMRWNGGVLAALLLLVAGAGTAANDASVPVASDTGGKGTLTLGLQGSESSNQLSVNVPPGSSK